MPSLNALVRQTLHILAIVWLGVMTGFFWAYSANVNHATLQMDGAMYAVVQSMLNRAVRHGLFFVFFFGPPVFCALAAIVSWPEWRRPWFACLLVAGVIYALGIVLLTARVNLPLNAYTESWNPQALPTDWADVRERWNRANLWRTALSALALLLATVALAARGCTSTLANPRSVRG